MFNPGRIQKLAEQVAQEIGRQVQWLKQGQLPEAVTERITEYSNSKPDRTLKVYATSLVGLHTLAKQRAKLDELTLQKLLNAILDMARNKDNFCVNRASLLRALIEFVDCIPDAIRAVALAALEPLARGAIEESSEYPTAAEMDDPLNPHKSHSGRPEDVQGMALIALAALASRDASTTERLGDILEAALCDHRPEIRRAAYAAAGRIPNVSEGIILGDSSLVCVTRTQMQQLLRSVR